MNRAIRIAINFITKDERGATAVEYALMAALIALVIFVAVQALGLTLKDIFGNPELDGALS